QNRAQTIIQMPNRKGVYAYQKQILNDQKNGLVDQAVARGEELAQDPDKDRAARYGVYVVLLRKHRDAIKTVLERSSREVNPTTLYDLEKALTDLLRGLPEDNAVKGQAMPELWAHPKMRDLGARL